MVEDSEIQRIARLTPLADVLASFDLSIGPVAPREEALAKALGLALAARPSKPRPAIRRRRWRLRDGYAVRSEQTLDASSYAPAPLPPAPARIETGEPLPEGADAVAALDAVQTRGAQAEALAAGRAGRRRARAGRRRGRGAEAPPRRRAAAADRRGAARRCSASSA